LTGKKIKAPHSVRALGLMSGGLDSMLAARVLKDQGVEVTGITFVTPFFGHVRGVAAAKILGIPHEIIDITGPHLEMVKDPAHGYGKNMNPCIDCHAMMFKIAGDLLEEMSADFLFSGEVLGQRPMSQNSKALRTVERESGYEGLILRPLSAKLLAETIPEKEGKIERSRLLDIQGRSRKRQMEIASGYGISEFPSPGGGCLLTDPGFSRRLKELFDASPDADASDVMKLRVGRHFRLPGGRKIIVGRHKKDNDELESLAGKGDCFLRVEDYTGPLTVVEAGASDEEVALAASITVRYGKAVDKGSVTVEMFTADGVVRKIKAEAAPGDLLEKYRVG